MRFPRPAPTDWLRLIGRARSHEAAGRVPFIIDTPTGPVPVGSVARDHLAALAPWQRWLQAGPEAVRLHCPAPQRDAVLGEVNRGLRGTGLIRAWRDETFAVVASPADAPLARIERAAARFWGTLTFGAHCNAYVADAAGRATHLWIARRSHTKPTDPGMLDNLVGGGVPHGQTPFQALVREGWEEAGLPPGEMACAAPGRVIGLLRDIPEGLQNEHLHVFDLALPAGLQPVNQDGEVAELWLAPLEQALALAAGDAMTVDAALVTLDFALRHRLLDDPVVQRQAAALTVP
jgi:8-oxo-dGTP pyrophosphatase MutT (NUDIX family)